MSTEKRLLTIGHGYVARNLSRLLRPKGWEVIGTSRRPDGVARIGAGGRLWPGTPLEPLVSWASHVLISASPVPALGCPALAELAGSTALSELTWLGYLSATSVYGDRNGGWAREKDAPNPGSARGQMRLATEQAWLDSGAPSHVFRLAGIYGPGRSVFDRMASPDMRRIIKPGQYFSRIHVDDIAQALFLSMEMPMPGAIWNLADDEPAPPEKPIEEAAMLTGRPVPPAVPFEKADLSPMARAFYSESKRIANDKVKADLGLVLRYPSYREGLRAILAAGGA